MNDDVMNRIIFGRGYHTQGMIAVFLYFLL